MTFQINYLEDGDILTGSHLMENDSYLSTIFLSYGLDALTATNQNNILLDLFTSDTASVSNMTYDSTNDWYECSSGSSDCALMTSSVTLTGVEDVAIVKSVGSIQATTNRTASVTFDDETTWFPTTEKELRNITTAGSNFKVKYNFERSGGSTGSDYIQGVAAYYG